MSVSKGAISVPPLGAARLYGIVDLGYVTAQQAGDVAHQMIIGGVDVLQLRAKGVTPDAQLTVALALRAVTASA